MLLSGEGTTVPRAEAESLFLAYDLHSRFESPAPRVLIVDSSADPFLIARRIAFARRVGVLVEDKDEVAMILRGRRVRFASFDLVSGRIRPEPAKFLEGVDAVVDLEHPEFELSLVRAKEEFLAITSPEGMLQGWSTRRPRRRPYFHPAAIFPKLSRAMVNLTRCMPGDLFLDPFAGTGSILIEASLVGARVIALDQSDRMVRGELANMGHFGQDWLGAVRGDATKLPLATVDSVATDVPYGRASSTRGRSTRQILDQVLPQIAEVLSPGRILVLMHPKEIPVSEGTGFSLNEEHDLHVHKRLIRTISVLRRR